MLFYNKMELLNGLNLACFYDDSEKINLSFFTMTDRQSNTSTFINCNNM